jgi:hypothetical protein
MSLRSREAVSYLLPHSRSGIAAKHRAIACGRLLEMSAVVC